MNQNVMVQMGDAHRTTVGQVLEDHSLVVVLIVPNWNCLHRQSNHRDQGALGTDFDTFVGLLGTLEVFVVAPN